MAQLNEQYLRMQKLAGVITESQYNKKMQMLNEEITVGETYTASMPTSSDGKERMDVKVKVLGVDRNDANKFIVTPLEDKDYTNPASKQLNSFEKGKQYGVEAEFIKESLNEGIKLDILMKDGKPNEDILVVPNKFYGDEAELTAASLRAKELKKEEGQKDMMVFANVGGTGGDKQFPIEGDEVQDIILFDDAKKKLR